MSRRRPHRLRHRLSAVAVLAALAATYLTPLVNSDWNAWRFDHGHASVTGFVGDHTHPWESAPATALHTDQGGSTFAYTASGDSVPGMPAIWRPAPVEAAPALLAIPVLEAAGSTPDSPVPSPPPPPPRLNLSLT